MKCSCLQLCQTSIVQAGLLAESELFLEVPTRMLQVFPRMRGEKKDCLSMKSNLVTILLKSFNVAMFQINLLKFSWETAQWQKTDFCHP